MWKNFAAVLQKMLGIAIKMLSVVTVWSHWFVKPANEKVLCTVLPAQEVVSCLAACIMRWCLCLVAVNLCVVNASVASELPAPALYIYHLDHHQVRKNASSVSLNFKMNSRHAKQSVNFSACRLTSTSCILTSACSAWNHDHNLLYDHLCHYALAWILTSVASFHVRTARFTVNFASVTVITLQSWGT
jgi:hypothetical protein